jgi:hypothetical protein
MHRRPFLYFPLLAMTAVIVPYIALTLLSILGLPGSNWTSVRADLFFPRAVIFAFACFIAGLFRGMAFHPRYLPKYANWLMATPWRPGMALPLAPVHLVWEDLLFIVPLGFLASFDADLSPLFPVICFLVGHGFLAAASLRDSRRVWPFVTLIFFWSWAALYHASVPVVVAMLIGVAIVSHISFKLSLEKFPWDLGDPLRELKVRPQNGLAWPLEGVGPLKPMNPIPQLIGWVMAILAGWWIYVLFTVFSVGSQPEMAHAMMNNISVFSAMGAVFRLIRYINRYWPPINLRGRVTTGQIIIPGYDQVFIAPLLMIAIAYFLPRFCLPYMPVSVVGAITVAGVIGVGLNLGPTFRRWQLTGHHRIFAGLVREPPVPKGKKPAISLFVSR